MLYSKPEPMSLIQKTTSYSFLQHEYNVTKLSESKQQQTKNNLYFYQKEQNL